MWQISRGVYTATAFTKIVTFLGVQVSTVPAENKGKKSFVVAIVNLRPQPVN